MPTLKRGTKIRREKHKADVVTGGFELHYEDIISRNRYALIAIFASGLVFIAAFVPGAVYKSVAKENHVSVEAESGSVINANLVTKVKGDVTASDGGYIEFDVE